MHVCSILACLVSLEDGTNLGIVMIVMVARKTPVYGSTMIRQELAESKCSNTFVCTTEKKGLFYGSVNSGSFL